MTDSITKGLYVGCKYDRDSIIKIKQLSKMLNVEPPDSEDLHTTICYSTRPPSKAVEYSNWPPQEYARARMIGLEVFNGRDGSNILVVMLDSKFLREQHHYFMTEYDLSYDFDQYRPHITLSYSYHSPTPPNFPTGVDLQLVINSVYTEPLKTEWNVSK